MINDTIDTLEKKNTKNKLLHSPSHTYRQISHDAILVCGSAHHILPPFRALGQKSMSVFAVLLLGPCFQHSNRTTHNTSLPLSLSLPQLLPNVRVLNPITPQK